MKNNKEYFKRVSTYIPWVILSAVIQSIAMSSFSVPGNMYPSGINGFARLTSDILFDKFDINVKYTIIYFAINLILAIIVYRNIGKMFTFLSLLQTALVSVLSTFFKPMFGLEDLMLISIFGGVINGFASSLALSHNASTGGLDFVTIYFSNKYKRSMWNITFGFNAVLIISTGIIYGWPRALYSMIFQFVTIQVINKMHKRYTSQTVTIITNKPDDVSNEIFKTIRHGITEVHAMGAYRKTDTTMLYTVINSYQTDDVVKAILRIDEKAFINIQDTKLVIGNYYQKPLD